MLLVDDDVKRAKDDEVDDEGPAPFMSCQTVKPQLWGSTFSIRCRASFSSSAVCAASIDPAKSSDTSILCFPFARLLSVPSNRTFFATSSSAVLLGAESAMTAFVTGGGTGDSLPVDVRARGFFSVVSSLARGVLVSVDLGKSGGDGCRLPELPRDLLGVVSAFGAVNRRRAGDRAGDIDGSPRAENGTAGGGIISLSLSRVLPRLLTVRASSSS